MKALPDVLVPHTPAAPPAPDALAQTDLVVRRCARYLLREREHWIRRRSGQLLPSGLQHGGGMGQLLGGEVTPPQRAHSREPSLEGDDDVDPPQLLQREDAIDRRRLLKTLLTVRPVEYGPLPPEIAADLDALLQRELLWRDVTDAGALPAYPVHAAGGAPRVALWRGDITSLRIDCIVNAANGDLRGCFQPQHACIDNAIHSAAGPQLRLECDALMRTHPEGYQEPVGLAKATRAYHLPARFVLHTVGPLIPPQRRNGITTAEEDVQLASCYTSCLDLAAELKARSVAFCCISTGVFGFPQQRAATIAIETVQAWLVAHPSVLDLVVFNVFRAEDENIYRSLLFGTQADAMHPTPASGAPGDELMRMLGVAAEWIGKADCLLIASGAGLSAAAGLDYTDSKLFRQLFPAMYRRGHRTMYEFIGYTDWSEALRWGYLATQVDLARFRWPQHPVYGMLLEMARTIAPNDYFCLTSNADGMFERNGFDPERIYTAQGDYSQLQCLRRCTDQVWPIRPMLDRVLPHVNPETMEIAEPSAIPVCPNCGGPVIMNVRGGNWFIEHPYREQMERFQDFVARAHGRRLVILEIGAGYNTPTVVRFRCESVTAAIKTARLIRVNAAHPEISMQELATRAVSIQCDGLQAVQTLHALLQQRQQQHAIQ